MLRFLSGILPLLCYGQRLGLGRAVTAQGQLVGADTIFSVVTLPARLVVQYTVPPGYGKDTFLLVLRHVVGVVGRLRMIPRPGKATLEAQIVLPRPGVYSAAVYRLRGGSMIWAHKRFYILAPPYTTLAQVRVQHNALLAQKKQAPAPSVQEISLPVDPLLAEPLPTTEKAELPPVEVEVDGLEVDILPMEGATGEPTPGLEDLELEEDP